ncbi:hypothetical protein Q2941_44285 [Bradyrhizobium sp. UFLA05-153]
MLPIDATHDPQQARQAYDRHLAHTEWMAKDGREHLLKGYPKYVN